MCANVCKNHFRYSLFPQMAFTLASLTVNTILSSHDVYYVKIAPQTTSCFTLRVRIS